MRKLDELLSSSNQENCSGQRENSRQADDGLRAPRHAEAPPRSKRSFEPKHREKPKEATPGARLPTVPHVRWVPDLTTVSHDFTMYISMFEPLNKSLETFFFY